MNANVHYALLDWDNTLRKGFTITSWTKYLCDREAIDKEAYDKLLKQFELHQTKRISYKQLATSTTEIYAQALSGAQLGLIKKLAHSFSREDTDVLPFTDKLFDSFMERKIETIIISGSPQIVLSQYAKRLGFSEIYGMDVEVVNGQYTGKVMQDFGAEKKCIVKDICHSRKKMPLIAFGDSTSDEPLLSAAKYGYLLDWKNKTILLNGHEIAPLSSIDIVIENLFFSSSE